MESMETERLKLRQLNEHDFDHFARHYADEDNSRYIGGRKDLEQAWRQLAVHLGHWRLKGFGYGAADEKRTNDFVGCVGLWKSPGWPELELGYWLMKEHQGKGYATEACKRCIQDARAVLNAGSLVSYIDPAMNRRYTWQSGWAPSVKRQSNWRASGLTTSTGISRQRHFAKEVRMNKPRSVEYADASPEVRLVFDDIGAMRKVADVNNEFDA